MRKTALKVTLLEKNTIKKEWEQHNPIDLPELIQALKIVKLSINDYLSDIICTQKGIVSSDQMELAENSEAEEDANDNILGFNEYQISLTARLEKRKADFLNQVKKVKK